MDFGTKLELTRKERISYLLDHGKTGAYSSMFAAGLVFTMLTVADRFNPLLLAWALLLCALGAARIYFLHRLATLEGSKRCSENQLSQYGALVVIAGFVWGLLMLNSGQGQTGAAMNISVIALAVVATVSMTSFAAISSIYCIFLTAVAISAIAGVYTVHGTSGLYVCAAFLVSFPLLFASGRRLEKNLTDSLWLQYEVNNLADKIHEKNTTLEKLNKSLQAKQDIIDEEEEVARHVFNQLIQTSEEPPRHCQYWMKPMLTFSGDIIQLARGPQHEEYILLGDFTGHGLPAALGAVPTSAIFKTMAQKGLPVHEIVNELNSKLCELLPTGYFCCAAVLMVDSDRDSATLWNGGLPEIILTNQQSGLTKILPSEHLPLGIQLSTMQASDTTHLALENDDFIYIYSDGITEVENPQGGMLGHDALKEIIAQPASNNSRMKTIRRAVQSFADGAPPSDDISLVEYHCIREEVSEEDQEFSGNAILW